MIWRHLLRSSPGPLGRTTLIHCLHLLHEQELVQQPVDGRDTLMGGRIDRYSYPVSVPQIRREKKMAVLTHLHRELQNNQLSGPIPPEMFLLSSLRSPVNISHNYFWESQDIPSDWKYVASCRSGEHLAHAPKDRKCVPKREKAQNDGLLSIKWITNIFPKLTGRWWCIG